MCWSIGNNILNSKKNTPVRFVVAKKDTGNTQCVSVPLHIHTHTYMRLHVHACAHTCIVVKIPENVPLEMACMSPWPTELGLQMHGWIGWGRPKTSKTASVLKYISKQTRLKKNAI